MSLNDNHYSKRLKCACTALATAFIGFAGIFAFAEEDGAVRSAVFVESPAKALDAIVQTSGKTPVATSEEAKIGKAKKKEATNGGKIVDELENLPDLNVRPDDGHVDHKPHGASLAGVQPGVTKMSELKSNPTFSKPVAEETVEGFKVNTYQDPTLPDATIQIVGKNDIVEAIMINLSEARSESDARKVFESEIKDVRPIWSPDEAGNFREVFPEKGVAFVLEAGETPGLPSNRVIQVVAETVKGEYFIMRAEQDLHVSYTYARDDAEHALLHDENAPGAHWILAQTHLAVGDITNARKHIFRAIKLNDSLPQFHLTYINTLIQAGEVDSALRYMDAVRDTFVEHPLYQIEGLTLDSILRHEQADPDYDGSIAQGQRALKLLGSLYEQNLSPDVIWSAKKLEEQANLSIAIAVARKEWKNEGDREKAFEWIDAATAVASELDKMLSEESQLPSAQIDVLQAGLDVCLDIPDAAEVDTYAQRVIAATDIYLKKTVDEVSAASVRWRAGQALTNAARIYEERKDYKKAASMGEKGLGYLRLVTEYRPPIDRIPTALAQLHLGKIYASGLDDAKAEKYFASANELFAQIQEHVRARDAAKVGAPLASAATICWKNGKKEEGRNMLLTAVTFLEKAHSGGFVKDSELYVSYSNLSTMSKGLKDSASAEKYKKLADKYAPQK